MINQLLTVLLCLLSYSIGIAQTGVMHLADNTFNTYMNLGIELKGDLLTQDNSGEATLEFWVKSTQFGNQWILTDLNTDTDHFSVSMANENELTVQLGNQTTLIDLSNEVVHNLWHHVALAISNNAQVMEVYINSIKKGQVNLPIGMANTRELYFLKKANTELSLTELRGWSKKRTASEIADNQWRTLVTQSPSGLSALKNDKGLQVFYGNDEQETTAVSGIAGLQQTTWKNIQTNTYAASCISGYDSNGDANYAILASVRTDVEHPVLNLDEIMLTASKGEFSDEVQLAWPHIKDVDGYNIYRNDQLIGNLSAAGLNISDNIIYDDANRLPSEIYTYKVTGYNNGDQNFYREGTSRGFIFSNGEITGTIKTESEVFVEQVEVTASPNQLPGSALKFDPGDSPITINSVEAFRKLNDFTIEFWYKADAGLSSTPFQLGQASIAFDNTGLQVKNGNGANYISTPVQTDNVWHHYAVVFSTSGGKIYEDGILLQSNNTAFAIDLSNENAFTLNATYPSATYRLDEFRVWEHARSDGQIATRYTHSISGHEAGLALYYRFDLEDTRYIYNQATATRGSYIGENTTDLEWLPAADQPSTLEYGSFTNEQGNYTLTQINAGIAPDGLSYTITPDKPNHIFNPASREEVIKSSLSAAEYEKAADFTDISSLPIAGKVLYKEGETVYPVPAGQQILLDGVLVNGEDTQTDAFGTYAISSPLGIHTFEVSNAPQIQYFGNQSIYLDSVWVQTQSILPDTDQLTISGWVKRDAFQDTPPALQTVLKLGDVKLVLKDNERLAVRNQDNDILVSSVILGDTFTFFAFTVDKSGAEVTLHVEDTYQQQNNVQNLDITNVNDYWILGADGTENNPINPFRGYLDQLEYRTESYVQALLESIKEGELIDGDEQALLLSYAFHQTMGKKAISVTATGYENYLRLDDNAVWSNDYSANYTREFDYEYSASNMAYNPQGNSYNLNIVAPITDLHFENQTRFGFIGNIVIPCENSLGAWEGTITRTDVVNPEFSKEINADNFNDDFTLFAVDGLMPGSYSVTLQNVDNPIKQLQSAVIDITKGWVSYDFEYRNPINITTALYEWDSDTDDLGNELIVGCNNIYELQAGTEYAVMIDVFEQYGNNSCPVENATVSLDGDLGVLGSGFSGATGEEGQLALVFAANKPNFLGEMTRAMNITASHDGRNTNAEITAYNTGSVQENHNFTIEHPTISMVLHDPPGDNSSIALNQSFSFVKEYSYAAGTEIGLDFGFGSGADTEVFAGLGVMNKVAAFAQKIGLGVTSSFTYKTTGGNSVEYTLDQSISTSSSDTFTGLDADVYIGLGTVIKFGTGKTLLLDNNCAPQVDYDIEVAKFDSQTPFVYTHQDIKDVLLVQLELLKQNAIDQQNQNDIDNYTHQIGTWEVILAENEAKRNDISGLPGFDGDEEKIAESENMDLDQDFDTVEGIPENISFSGLTSQTYQFYQQKSESEGNVFGGGAGLTQNSETYINGFSIGLKFKLSSKIIGLRENQNNTTNTKGGGYSFTLEDDDAGDHFNVNIKKDSAYSTPIFETTAGQSACPFESGTQPREGVELISDPYEIHALSGETTAYTLTMRNTQLAVDNTPKSYFIAVHQAGNPEGAIVRYNGSPLGNGVAINFDLDPNSPVGVEQELYGQLTIEAPDYVIGDVSYVDIPIVMYSGCEANGFAYLYHLDELAEVGINVTDTVYLTAHFRAPCIEAITVQTPADQWVVNGTDNDELELVFQIPGLTDQEAPESLTTVRVEYALEGNNTPNLLQEILLDSLQSHYQQDQYIHYTLDVSALADGNYQIRLVPQCGLGNEPWRSSNPTAWLSGSIYRIPPVITEVYPAENTIMTTGTISASYDRPLTPSGVNSLNVSLRGILGGLEYVPKSADFNAITDQITIPDQQALDLESAYTVEFWINPSAYANNGDKVPLIKKGTNLGISLTTDGKIDNGRDISSQPLTPFIWTHVAVVYDGEATIKTYFDSQLVSEKTNVPPYPVNDDDFTIGATYNGDGFRGQLDEVRIWNIARSKAEISTDRTRRLLGNEDGLAAYYVLDDIALELDGFQEGIRDYTGKTTGTIATDITWVEKDQAAPINVEKVIQDVPIDAILSGGNQILITPKANFPEYYLEGAELTAFIADQSISDVYGNPALGKSWDFTINKNQVQWAQNNLSLNQAEGVASAFAMDLTNGGSIEVTYAFIDLPVWLQVSNDPGNGTLSSGFTTAISFETAAWLNPGVHGAYVKADILDPNAGRIGVESFYLEVTVNCPDPGYSFDVNQYPDFITLTAQLTAGNVLSEDENDIVAAYYNGELRGTGQVSYTNGQYLVSMNIYGHLNDNGALDFRVWDASECKEYQGVIENHGYQSGVSIGSLNNPASLTTGSLLVKSLPLPAGYHWVSFNLRDIGQTSLSIESISNLNEGDTFTTPNGTTATYTQGVWTGTFTLAGLDYTQHYLMYLTQGTTLQFEGELVSENTDIAVVQGTSWVSYLPEQMMRTGRAVISLSNTTATNGDQVQGKEGFAEYLDGAWIGTLTHLTPNRGYRMVSSQSGVLNYYGIAGNPDARHSITDLEAPLFAIKEQAASTGWQVDEHAYPEAMYLTGVIESDLLDHDQAHVIGAFVDGECRGVAIPQEIEGRLQYFMVVYGHQSDATITFSVINSSTGLKHAVANTASFTSGSKQGSYAQPYTWAIGAPTVEQTDDAMVLYPNPMDKETTIEYTLSEASSVALTITDLMGRKVRTLVNTDQEAGKYQIKWNGEDDHKRRVASGTYIVRIESSMGTLQHRTIVVE